MEANIENLEKIIYNTNLDQIEFELFFMWSESVTIDSREFQKVLSNAGVKRWFDYELGKHINEYYFLANQYPNATENDLFKLYLKCIAKIFSYRPQALLEVAKRKEVTTEVKGIALTTSLIRMN